MVTLSWHLLRRREKPHERSPTYDRLGPGGSAHTVNAPLAQRNSNAPVNLHRGGHSAGNLSSASASSRVIQATPAQRQWKWQPIHTFDYSGWVRSEVRESGQSYIKAHARKYGAPRLKIVWFSNKYLNTDLMSMTVPKTDLVDERAYNISQLHQESGKRLIGEPQYLFGPVKMELEYAGPDKKPSYWLSRKKVKAWEDQCHVEEVYFLAHLGPGNRPLPCKRMEHERKHELHQRPPAPVYIPQYGLSLRSQGPRIRRIS